jgi:predicted dehydrogenase
MPAVMMSKYAGFLEGIIQVEPVRFGQVGVGGYGRQYFQHILALEGNGMATFGSVAIRTPGKYPEQEKVLAEHNVPIRHSLGEMLEKDRDKIDVICIPTGIDSHRDLLIQSAEAGFNVLLEKPTAATIQDFDAMIEVLERTGRWCAIGFQSQWDTNVIAVKKLICSGRIGAIKEAIVIGNWARNDNYFTRNAWSGSFMYDDKYILDGTINNPMAHHLFNALYFSSPEWGQTAIPISVRAELYRAHNIQSEDTSCLEMICDNGSKVMFYGSLNSIKTTPPTIEIIGEKGRIEWQAQSEARLYDGETLVEKIPAHDGNPRKEMFENIARFMRGEDKELYCPISMTRAHVLAVNAAFESAQSPVTIPKEYLKLREDAEDGNIYTETIPDILELSTRASAERKLYSDMDVPWAVKSKSFSLSGYTKFEVTI